VGGEVEMIKDEKKLKFIGKEGKTIPKAEVMRRRLVNDYGIPAENLICLTSASNTTGNALEILRYFTEKNVTDLNEIGLLTRFYHIPRSVKIFKESANLSLVPICTESIVYDEEFELIKDFYSKEGLLEIIGDIKNSDSEIKGMGDQEKGSYVPRFK
jgi:hypothetical protein